MLLISASQVTFEESEERNITEMHGLTAQLEVLKQTAGKEIQEVSKPPLAYSYSRLTIGAGLQRS